MMNSKCRLAVHLTWNSGKKKKSDKQSGFATKMFTTFDFPTIAETFAIDKRSTPVVLGNRNQNGMRQCQLSPDEASVSIVKGLSQHTALSRLWESSAGSSKNWLRLSLLVIAYMSQPSKARGFVVDATLKRFRKPLRPFGTILIVLLYSYVCGHPRVLLYHHDGRHTQRLRPDITAFGGASCLVKPAASSTIANADISADNALFIGRPNRLSKLSITSCITAGKQTRLLVMVAINRINSESLRDHDNFITKHFAEFDDVLDRCYLWLESSRHLLQLVEV